MEVLELVHQPYLKEFMKTHKIVKVEWEDSTNYRGWRDTDRAKKCEPATCISSGILVKTKRGSIGVTHTVAPSEDEFADIIVISRKAIRKMEVLDTFKK